MSSSLMILRIAMINFLFGFFQLDKGLSHHTAPNLKWLKKSLGFIFLISLFASCQSKKDSEIEGIVYKTKNGFGYRVIVHDQLLINQDFIPAIQENVPFCDSIEAAAACHLVIQKIKRNEMPTLTLKDLSTLKIKT